MKLKYTLETFTPDAWERVFGAFVKVNRSHWRGAPYDAVINQLKVKGVFEFAVTGMNTWSSKFALKLLPDNHLDAEFITNDTLSPLMQKHLAKMKQEFELALSADKQA
jgi:hypothetical protein